MDKKNELSDDALELVPGGGKIELQVDKGNDGKNTYRVVDIDNDKVLHEGESEFLAKLWVSCAQFWENFGKK